MPGKGIKMIIKRMLMRRSLQVLPFIVSPDIPVQNNNLTVHDNLGMLSYMVIANASCCHDFFMGNLSMEE